MGHIDSALHGLLETPIASLPKPSKTRMYAIAFDLDTTQLQHQYPNASWQNAYGDVRRVLQQLGFQWQQGSVYFGNAEITAVDCVLAAQRLSRDFAWFKGCVRDIRMLRIEELNDLAPAL
jgi:virulence-associated protein VapD